MPVDLHKEEATFFVVANDEGAYVGAAAFVPKRDVLHVERMAGTGLECHLQRVALEEGVEECQSPLQLLAYTAHSHAHAAGMALRDWSDEWTFIELEDTFHAPERAFDGIAATFTTK